MFHEAQTYSFHHCRSTYTSQAHVIVTGFKTGKRKEEFVLMIRLPILSTSQNKTNIGIVGDNSRKDVDINIHIA